ncbi:response regulator [Hymenobacter sp. NST-14]|uniref:response regulator n=1 Tax=Hymenobacter piscis TaxID=2839984 RepID=UPI001C014A02|nr:response regulator [Hymenobacter piscis]MBT9394401.1 response regulator [Hymenobacter piscis]
MDDHQFTGHFSGLLNALEPLRRIQEMVNQSVITPGWMAAYRQQFQPLEAIASQFSAAMPAALLDQMQLPEAVRQQLPGQQLGSLLASIGSQVSQNILATGVVPSPWPMPVLAAIGDYARSFRELAAWQTDFMYQLREAAAEHSAELPDLEDYGQHLLQELEHQPDATQQLQQLQSMTAAIVQPTRTDATIDKVQAALAQLVSLEQQNGHLLKQLVAQGNDAGKTFREYLNLIIAALGLLISYLALNQPHQQAMLSQQAGEAPAATTAAVAAGSILIVEDDGLIAGEMGRSVQRMGYTALESVCSGQEALDALRTARVSLVVTNIKLEGEMTGVELAQKVRQQYGIPVLLVSAYPSKMLQAQVQAGVVQGYVSKPFTDLALQAGIRRALGQPE